MEIEQLIDLVFRKESIEKSFFSHSYLMFLVVSADTGISQPSPSFLKYFGYDEQDDLPDLNDMMHPDDWLETTLMHKYILETGKMPIDFHHYRLRKKDGTYSHIQTMQSIIINEKNDLMAVMFPIPEGQRGITVYKTDYLEWKKK